MDLTIRSQIPSYNIPAQSLAERLVVQDSDYHELHMYLLTQMGLFSTTLKSASRDIPWRLRVLCAQSDD